MTFTPLARPFPIYARIHGGGLPPSPGFTSGDKNIGRLTTVIPRIVSGGIAVANINYSLATPYDPSRPYPTPDATERLAGSPHRCAASRPHWRCTIAMTHGTADRFVPYVQAQRIMMPTNAELDAEVIRLDRQHESGFCLNLFRICLVLPVLAKGIQAMRNKTKSFIFLLALTLASSKAMCSEWNTLPRDDKSPLVAASYKNDDGGMLVVRCDTTSKIISIGLEEPRAHWQTGAPMPWITKADAGAEFVPSRGFVIAPTRIIVKAQSNLDIRTMGQAKNFFIVDVGDYSRIFPTVNFKKAIGQVLHACGDHW